jgi:hypothetical protein
MHRVHREIGLAACLALAAARLPAAPAVAPADDPSAWVADLRAREGVAALATDPLLGATAAAYATELAAAGVLSHAGPSDGSGPLERFLRAGGTAFTVGEILGAGPDLPAIQRAWEASGPHRRVVVDGRFTRLGWGSATVGAQVVWVVMFARSAVADLALQEVDGVLEVSGRLGPAWAAVPWLDAGSGEVAPAAWDPASRRFLYRVAMVEGRARFLLGCRDRFGDREATDSVTWPRGTASPAGSGRSSSPAPRP